MKNMNKSISLTLLSVIASLAISCSSVTPAGDNSSSIDAPFTSIPDDYSAIYASKSTMGTPSAASGATYICQGEFYTTNETDPNNYAVDIYYDYKPNALSPQYCTLHIGGSQQNPNPLNSNVIVYQINFLNTFNNATMSIRYSDDVAGNKIRVKVDNGTPSPWFTTVDTSPGVNGGSYWNNFIWTSANTFSLGTISAGVHTIRIYSTDGYWGVNLDAFQIKAN